MGAYGETYNNDLPGAIVDGFALEHVHRIPSTSPPPPPRAKIRTQSRDTATDAPEPFRTPRDRIATFLKMNAIAYPASNATEPPQWWLNAAYSELLGSNASHFPGRPKGLEAEIAWRARQFRRFMTTVGLQWPETTVPSTTGQEPSLAVLVFRNPRTRATVLVFRGTMSRADVDDSALWYAQDWVYYKWREGILCDWQNLLGQPVTPAMRVRGRGFAEWAANGLLWHAARYGSLRHAHRLALATGMDERGFRLQGYWPLLKRVVREVLATSSGKVYLTGHSKGGALAALTSMWLAQETGIRYPTYALEATGYQCWANRALRDDVDSSDPHPQIVTYRDALSHYARLDRPVGRVVIYGVDAARVGVPWCSKIVGYPGAQVFVRPSVLLAAARCRYFHHDVYAMMYHLLHSDSPYRLAPNGVPVAHYVIQDHPRIPFGDARCPLPACMQMIFGSRPGG
jgi:hypothetical protein